WLCDPRLRRANVAPCSTDRANDRRERRNDLCGGPEYPHSVPYLRSAELGVGIEIEFSDNICDRLLAANAVASGVEWGSESSDPQLARRCGDQAPADS